MKLSQLIVASAALAAVMGAHAQVSGSLGGGSGSFLSLSSAGLSGGSVATLSGGTVYNSDRPFADIPFGVVYEGNFLAAGPTSGTLATLSFSGAGLDYISFLWGSPDVYNVLTVTTTGGVTKPFTAAELGFAETNGDQGFSQYVQFSALAGSKITALSFSNLPQMDAFESSNFSVTPVPEPQTYALLLAGLAGIGFVANRRRPS
jgi:PEP-CTERM motif